MLEKKSRGWSGKRGAEVNTGAREAERSSVDVVEGMETQRAENTNFNKWGILTAPDPNSGKIKLAID